MDWCDASSDMSWSSASGPSTCLWYSVFMPIPGFYLFASCTYIFYKDFIPFRRLDEKTVLFVRTLQSLCLLQVVFTLGFALSEPPSGSVLFGTVVQILSWALCGAAFNHDAWCLTNWPSPLLLLFLFLQLGEALVFAVSSYSGSGSTVQLIACTALFVISSGLVLLSLYKDTWFRGKDERLRLSVQRNSMSESRRVQRYGGSDMSFVSTGSGRGLSLQLVFSWFGAPRGSPGGDDDDGNDVDEPLVRSRSVGSRQHSIASSRRSRASKGFSSWFSGGNGDGEGMYDSDEGEDGDDDFDDEQNRATVNLLRSYNAGGTFHGDFMVKSALGGDSGDTRSARHSLVDPTVLLGGIPMNDCEALPGGDLPADAMASSGVLQRALKGSKLSANIMGGSLAPRGFRATPKAATKGSTFSSESAAEPETAQFNTYCATVINWGLRRDQRTYSNAHHGGSMDDGARKGSSADLLGGRYGARGAVRDRSYAMNDFAGGVSAEEGPDSLESCAAVAEHHSSFMSFRARWGGKKAGVSQGAGSSSQGAPNEEFTGEGIAADGDECYCDENDDNGHTEDSAGDRDHARDPEGGTADFSVTSSRRKSSDPVSLGSSSNNNLLRQKPLVVPQTAGFGSALGNHLSGQQASKVGAKGEELVSLDSDCELMQREFGVGAEIEFEICIQNGDRRLHSAAGMDSWRTRSGQDGNSQSSKWSLWKTAKEILTLHSCVLSVLGDAAPRRPKLKTIPEHNRSATGNNTIIPHASIVSDMRNIAAYLTGLLQHHRHLRCGDLYYFLEFAKHSPNGTAVAASRDASGSSVMNVEDVMESDGERENDDCFGNDVIEPSSYVTSAERLDDPEGGGLAVESSTDPGGVQAQERWRKLFVNMRVHLKPSAMAIRCRLFEGVIAGADICKWLVQCKYKFAQDSAEACVIGQELVSSGLLQAVCCGYENKYDRYGGQYYDSEDEEDEGSGRYAINDDTATRETKKAPCADGALGNEEECRIIPASSPMAMTFSTGTGYLYRYPSKSNTGLGVGSYSLFGSLINVSVARWAKRDGPSADDDGGEGRSLRDSLAIGYEVEKKLEASTEGQGYIHYEIVIKHQDDEWVVWKRYREFEQYNKLLFKCGIRPALGLPSKRIMSSVSTFGQSVNLQIETRRASLEAFLVSAVEAVMVATGESSTTAAAADQSKNAATAQVATAKFLDDEFSSLIKVEPAKQPSIAEDSDPT